MTQVRPTSTKRPPAVILGGLYPTFSVARSLGSRGIDVHGLGESGNTLLSRSRFVTSFTPAPDDVDERWRKWFTAGPRGSVVLPCGDLGLEFIARNRAWLEDLGYLPVEGNDPITLAMLDKGRTYELAEAAGVDVPRTAQVDSVADLERVADTFEYPCALKPRDSFHFNELFAQKAIVVHSSDDLREAFERLRPTGFDMLVTEIVASAENELYEFPSYYTYLDERGEPLFHFTKRKLRQYPLGWGTGTYHVSKWDPRVAEAGLAFAQGVGVRGIANVEFKLDRRDNRLKLIECNPRPTASDKLCQLAGLDLAWIAYRRAVGETVEPIGGFRDGVRQWNPPRDFLAFLEGRRAGSISTGSWLRSLAHRQHLPTFDVRDPGPTIALWKLVAYRALTYPIRARQIRARQRR